MHNELRFAGWQVDRVGPIGDDWIPKLWLPKARELLAVPKSEVVFRRPTDHIERLKRVFNSLKGLAIGDALGEMLAYRHGETPRIICAGLPAGPWFHTDDTEMAISIVDVLKLYGYIHSDALARRFAWHFDRQSNRGYGSMTRIQMREIIAGASRGMNTGDLNRAKSKSEIGGRPRNDIKFRPLRGQTQNCPAPDEIKEGHKFKKERAEFV